MVLGTILGVCILDIGVFEAMLHDLKSIPIFFVIFIAWAKFNDRVKNKKVDDFVLIIASIISVILYPILILM